MPDKDAADLTLADVSKIMLVNMAGFVWDPNWGRASGRLAVGDFGEVAERR